MSYFYKKAGVDLESGYEVVRRIKKHADSTFRAGVMGGIGSFGGMFDISGLNVKNPVLVSSTDGVGTKLKLAFAMKKYDSVGIDAVAMCVNDVLAQGADPLYFLDYIAVGVNVPAQIENIVSGVAEGCRRAGCALIGGETAEMPGMYSNDEFDITGFATGVVDRSALIDGSKVGDGDVLIGIASSGIHSNGFSLVRKIIDDNKWDLFSPLSELDENISLGEVLMTPTSIYVKSVLPVLHRFDVHAVCHITGGGFDENIPRVLNYSQGVVVEEGSWGVNPIFSILEKYGKIPHREMFNIFNMGIGMVLVVSPDVASDVVEMLSDLGEDASVIGRVVNGCGVTIK